MEKLIAEIGRLGWIFVGSPEVPKFIAGRPRANPIKMIRSFKNFIIRQGLEFGSGRDIETRHQANAIVSFRSNTLRGAEFLRNLKPAMDADSKNRLLKRPLPPRENTKAP